MDLDGFLRTSPALQTLTSQNGWIDNDSLRYEVAELRGAEVTVNVWFTEVLVEGAGCIADRRSRYGRLRLTLDQAGDVSDWAVV
jgi:hypothetical protein